MEKTNEELFPHEEFIANNTINVDQLHAKLKEGINHFEILKKIYEDWNPPEEDELTTRETFHRELTIKSIQILEAIIEEFADQLENNEEQEDQEEEAKTVALVPLAGPELPTESKADQAPEHESEPEPEQPPKVEAVPEKPKEKTDDEILQSFLDKGVKSALPRVFRKAGLRATLQGRKVKVGNKFTLVKGAFTLDYRIVPNSNY